MGRVGDTFGSVRSVRLLITVTQCRRMGLVGACHATTICNQILPHVQTVFLGRGSSARQARGRIAVWSSSSLCGVTIVSFVGLQSLVCTAWSLVPISCPTWSCPSSVSSSWVELDLFDKLSCLVRVRTICFARPWCRPWWNCLLGIRASFLFLVTPWQPPSSAVLLCRGSASLHVPMLPVDVVLLAFVDAASVPAPSCGTVDGEAYVPRVLAMPAPVVRTWFPRL